MESDTITSLEQLSAIYRTKSPHQLAQSLVYGKPKSTQQSNLLTSQTQLQHKTSKENFALKSVDKLPPSKLTQLSQQLYNHVSTQLSEIKSSRAFYQKDCQLLLSPERLHSMPSPQRTICSDLTNRLMDVNSDKKEKLKELVYQEQMQQCSFHPEINPKSRTLASKTNQEVRNADEFHEDLMRKDQYYKERREQAQNEKIQMEQALLSNPKLNPKSEELARKRSPNRNVVERLYSNVQSKQLTQPSQTTESSSFGRPEISAKSKKIKRDKPVEECLYEDALKRREVQQRNDYQSQSQVGPTDNSISWFVQKFIKDFYYELSCLERIQEQKDYSKLTYTETLQLLIGLSFLKSPTELGANSPQLQYLASIWNYVTKPGQTQATVLSRNLLVFLLAVLNVPNYHIQIPLYKPTSLHEDNSVGLQDALYQKRADHLHKDDEQISQVDIKPLSPKPMMNFDDAGNLILTDEIATGIHITYQDLYYNTKQTRNIRKGVQQQEEIIASPKLSINTYHISMKKKGETNLMDWFNKCEEEKKNKLESIKEQLLQQELSQCQFERVKQMTINLNSLARPQVKQQDKKKEDIEYEKQQDHCTFKPSRIVSPKSGKLTKKVEKDIMKTSERLKEARVRKEAQQDLFNKGVTSNNKSRFKAKQVAQQNLSQKPLKKKKTIKSQAMFLTQDQNQQNFQVDKQEDEKMPLLFVDVNIEEGKTARIVVFDGDQSEELAEKFANEYNLDDQMKIKLKELLDLQISSLLTKIEEESEKEQEEEEETEEVE